jgi:hypothetical protein
MTRSAGEVEQKATFFLGCDLNKYLGMWMMLA